MTRMAFGVFGGMVLIAPAVAQQPSADPRLAAYRTLLLEANDRVVSAMGDNQVLTAENARLKAEIAKLKAPPLPSEPDKK